MFEDAKVEIRSRKLKDRQYNQWKTEKIHTTAFLEQHSSGRAQVHSMSKDWEAK
jgi:hypothetical protein